MMRLCTVSYSQIIIYHVWHLQALWRESTALILSKLNRNLIEMPGMNEIWGRIESRR
jgi:hypothetical protein